MAPSRANIQDFDSVYQSDANFRYPRDVVNEITKSRERLGGKLFFDRLLDEIEIDGQDVPQILSNGIAYISTGKKVYPPQTNVELRKLYKTIIASDVPEHVKQTIVFYLLSDLEVIPGKDAASQFVQDCFLPNKLITFVEGIHSLDRSHFEPAMENLTSPSLAPKYTSEILAALLYAGKGKLALAYYQTVSPSLEDHDLLVQYFTMIAEGSVTEAFYFIRTQRPSMQCALLQILIERTCRGTPDEGIELVDLPFTQKEEADFEHFLLRDIHGRNCPHAADMVMMRRISTGKFAQAKEDYRTLNLSKTPRNDITWSNIMDGLEKGLGPRNATDIYEHD
ncbi:hypothetical protein EG327_009351 [Venturia inaequalis]|uniref:ELYS-like domain-containing protein n=1 Tax=Venturia inaequalis TaxID=5025 RepID=A0A8H3UMK4_VENIN|nr:hypothetical protein EG327_009351 [Venturia inaequalis]